MDSLYDNKIVSYILKNQYTVAVLIVVITIIVVIIFLYEPLYEMCDIGHTEAIIKAVLVSGILAMGCVKLYEDKTETVKSKSTYDSL